MARSEWILREDECSRHFQMDGPFWFICAQHQDRSVFIKTEDYDIAVNSAAIAAARTGVKVYIDVYMSNHGHWLVGCRTVQEAESFFEEWAVQISQWEIRKGLKSNLRSWPYKVYDVPDLRAFRNITAYIARNGYEAIKDTTPYSYAWGSADLFFNGTLRDNDSGRPYSDLTVREKKAICHSHNYELPDNYRVKDGRILKTSYIQMPGVQLFFNSGNQYFNMLARNSTSDIEISRMIGEKIMLPDDEVYSAISSICSKEYGKSLKEINVNQRWDLAKKMRFDYNSNNRQIAQILRIPIGDIERVFPKG